VFFAKLSLKSCISPCSARVAANGYKGKSKTTGKTGRYVKLEMALLYVHLCCAKIVSYDNANGRIVIL
jgi:hypothetical protein